MKTVDAERKNKISINLKYLLDAENKSRKRVCEDLDIKYTTLCDWVNGKTAPGYHILTKLGEYFEVEPWLFYEDLEVMKRERIKRMAVYAAKLTQDKQLDMDVLEKMNDEQIKSLLDSGFRFRHRTLEEYIALSGKPFKASEEFDWGEPVGREIW